MVNNPYNKCPDCGRFMRYIGIVEHRGDLPRALYRCKKDHTMYRILEGVKIDG